MEYKNIANTLDLSYQEWLKIRKSYIGGSDAGAIVGVNPWSSPASVWLSKQEDHQGIEDNERMRIGRDLEDYVAKRFEEATGKRVRKNNFMMVSKNKPFMMANIDREIVGERAILECKTTGSYSKGQWEDGEVPPHYYCQVQHYLAVMGYKTGYIAVLIGNEAFKWYEIPRDEDYIKAIIAIEEDFYNKCMVGGGFPEPDGTKGYTEALNARYKKSKEAEVELDFLEPTLENLSDIKAKIKDLKEDQEKLEQEIKLEMKENETARIGDRLVSWKTVASNKFDKKSFENDHPEIAEKYYTTNKYRRFSYR